MYILLINLVKLIHFFLNSCLGVVIKVVHLPSSITSIDFCIKFTQNRMGYVESVME